MIHFRIRFEQLRDRLGAQRRRRLVLRAAWLSLLVPLIGLLARYAGWTPWTAWTGFGLTGLAFVLAWLWQSRRLAGSRLERELDRRFGLAELLTTAVEVDRRGAQSGVEVRLLDDAASAVAGLDGAGRLDRDGTRREAEMLAGLALVLAGLWILMGSLVGLPELERWPGLPPLETQTLDPSGSEPGAGGPGPGSAAGARLAGALGDHAAAGDIARALAQGDPAAAARAARSLADRAGGLSEGGREALADALQEVARELEPIDPELAEALRGSGRELGSDRPTDRAKALEDLASALDALSTRRRPDPSPVEASLRSGPPVAALNADPTVLGLRSSRKPDAPRSSGRTTGASAADAPLEGPAEAPDRAAGPAGIGRIEAAGLQVGTDPQRVPWELRDTVRRYFAPAERAP